MPFLITAVSLFHRIWGGEPTRNWSLDILFSVFFYFLRWEIHSAIRENLDGCSTIFPHFFEKVEAKRKLFYIFQVRKKHSDSSTVFDCLRTPLSLHYDPGVRTVRSVHRKMKLLRGSIGCAASPINTTLPFVHEEIGLR